MVFVEEDGQCRSPVDEVFKILVLWKIDVCFQIDLVVDGGGGRGVRHDDGGGGREKRKQDGSGERRLAGSGARKGASVVLLESTGAELSSWSPGEVRLLSPRWTAVTSGGERQGGGGRRRAQQHSAL